jgi:hypothetical protein
VDVWEQSFVETFVSKRKRERYLGFLSNPKHRSKFLHDLNNGVDVEPSLAREVLHSDRSKAGLRRLLQSSGASGTVHLMALQHELDGCDAPLEDAIDLVLTSSWGVLLICPPRPVVLYKTEDPGTLLFLQPGPGVARAWARPAG